MIPRLLFFQLPFTKMEKNMKTGLIFDMDGTLWDSAENIAVAWSSVMARVPNPDRREVSAEEIHSIMGLTMTDIAQRLFPASDAVLRKAIMEECMEVENRYLEEHGGILYENLENTFQKLRRDNWPLYIVSNCQSGYIEAFLDHYGFGKYFDDIDCFGNTGLPKSGTIRLLADRCQLDNFYYIGDIQADCDAALAAGGKFIHASYGFGTVRETVPTLEKFSDLPELLKQLQT